MEENRDFNFYKRQLRDYHSRVSSADELVQNFNRPDDQAELREIIKNLHDNLSENPSPAENYAMYFAYADIAPEYMGERDRKNLWKYAKAFIDTCPKEHNLSNHIYRVIKHIPQMEASSGQKFNCALSGLNLLPKDYPYYHDCRKQVEKIAKTDYEHLLTKARNERNYRKQIKAYDRALARITNLAAGDRYRTFYDCMQELAPIYEQTDWGKVELPHKRRVVSNRIFKSLPRDMQMIIRNRKSQRDWWNK